MSYHVYHKPLISTKGESASIPFVELAAKVKATDPYPMMYLRFAVSGTSQEIGSGAKPILNLQTENGKPLPLVQGTADNPIYSMPHANKTNKVAGARIDDHDAHLVIVTVYEPKLTRVWSLAIENLDPDKERACVCVVADNKAETEQPWIELPSELDFGVVGREALGQPEKLLIKNRGTGPLTIKEKDSLLSKSDFAINTWPEAPIAPNGSIGMEVQFLPTGTPRVVEAELVVASNDQAVPTEAGASHNNKVTLKATEFGITGINPSSGRQADPSFEVTISGFGLPTFEQINMVDFGAGINSSVKSGTEREIKVDITIGRDAKPGSRTFEITPKKGDAIASSVPFIVNFIEPKVTGITADPPLRQGEIRTITITGVGLNDVAKEAKEVAVRFIPDDIDIQSLSVKSDQELQVVVTVARDADTIEHSFEVLVLQDSERIWVYSGDVTVKVEPIQPKVIGISDNNRGRQGETVKDVIIKGQGLKGATELRSTICTNSEDPDFHGNVKKELGNDEMFVADIKIRDDAFVGDHSFVLADGDGDICDSGAVRFTVTKPLRIDSVEPPTGKQGDPVKLTLKGWGFNEANKVTFKQDETELTRWDKSKDNGNKFVVEDDSSATLQFTISSNQLPGEYNLIIEREGGPSLSLDKAFGVEEKDRDGNGPDEEAMKKIAEYIRHHKIDQNAIEIIRGLRKGPPRRPWSTLVRDIVVLDGNDRKKLPNSGLRTFVLPEALKNTEYYAILKDRIVFDDHRRPIGITDAKDPTIIYGISKQNKDPDAALLIALVIGLDPE